MGSPNRAPPKANSEARPEGHSDSPKLAEISSRCYPITVVQAERVALRSVLFLLPVLGCGPLQSSTLLVDAQAELAAAKTAEAEKAAPFEFTAAEEYLHKAREEQSYADYEVSVTFAKKARDCARLARQISETKMRTTMGATGGATGVSPKCRPGPERSIAMLDPNEEPAAQEPQSAKKTGKKVAKEAKKRTVVKPGPEEPKDPSPT